jgi:hypothetical protein
MKKTRILITGLLFIAFSLFTFNAFANGPLEEWEHTFPDASKALGKWAKKHKEAATYIFSWDGDHPDRSQELVNWSIDHPTESLHKFHKQHKDWPELDEIESTHKAAFEDFLDWCRNNADAAKDLMSHPGALHWASEHICKDYKDMEKLK